MNEIAGAVMPNAPKTPSSYTNRCALSEAWFRSLYTTRQHGGTSPPTPVERAVNPLSPEIRNAAAPAKSGPQTILGRAASMSASRQRPTSTIATAYRLRGDRAAHATPAARGWRVALARRIACRFALSGGGSVDLLLLQRGRRMHVVAVANAAPKTAQCIGEALLRARATLAAHGLHIEIDVREKGSA